MKVIFSLVVLSLIVLIWWMYFDSNDVKRINFSEDDSKYSITEKDANMSIKSIETDDLEIYNLIKKENE